MRGHGIHAVLMGMLATSLVGVLTAAVGVAIAPCYVAAKIDSTRNNIDEIQAAMSIYRIRYGHYPAPEVGVRALVDAQILEKVPMDGWCHEFVYELDGRPVIHSLGADSERGGSGLDADIYSNDFVAHR